MKIEQKQWTKNTGWVDLGDGELSSTQLVLVFGDKNLLENPDHFNELRNCYPEADIITCSTAGEIIEGRVCDNTINSTAISFNSTKVKSALVSIRDQNESYEAGKELLNQLAGDDLAYTLVISDGHVVNGSAFVRGLGEHCHKKNIITGGLAGDGDRFESTLVGLNKAPSQGNIVGVGFYGKDLKVGHAAKGGWDPFGPERVVTKSKDNILYELDGVSALDLYKKYLGDLSKDLPGSALLFPLSIKINGSQPLVRTVLSVDEDERSMTFAGDMPEGSIARMMKSNFNRLIDGASQAADISISEFGSFDPDLSLLVSCVGRKIALGKKVEDELDSVKEVLGDNTIITGFFSYGEISPLVKSAKCELHNQTMTITTFKEIIS